MESTYKVMETIYRNGCELCETQMFDDTNDFVQAINWVKQAKTEDNSVVLDHFSRHPDDEMTICYTIEEYMLGEFIETVYID